MFKRIKSLSGNALATMLGIGTSLCTAYAAIDFATFDFKKEWYKLIVIGLPALGGYVSTLNKPKQK